MKKSSRRRRQELFWPKVVMRKWLNTSPFESDYSADAVDSDSDSDSDSEESGYCSGESQFWDANKEDENNLIGVLPRLRRRSETFRAQYITTKELRVCVGTWNVGGELPPDDLDIESWLDANEPADMYVVGFQEIIPLNAGNIFGAEDSRPVPKWESVIRRTLNRIRLPKPKFKCYSDPSSPSRFKLSEDAPHVEDIILLEADTDGEEEIHPLEKSNSFHDVRDGLVAAEHVSRSPEAPVSSDIAQLGMLVHRDLEKQFPSPKKLDKLNRLGTDACNGSTKASLPRYTSKLTTTISVAERVCLTWPEPQLDLLAKHVSTRPNRFKSIKSFIANKSIDGYSSFKLAMTGDSRVKPVAALLTNLDLESLVPRKRRPPFVRIVSKQMVGIFLTIWVHRSLRRHIKNVNVSTVGVGVMGYIGNKGSISVSMSIYQTLFCFICTHLTSGEKDTEAVKRNADVHEVDRRTRFHSLSTMALPKSIHDHERIIWLGDLNYRINLPYKKTQELISKKDWSNLAESDQLIREFRKGGSFDGWCEGTIDFPPTYKYELNSEKYYGEDPKVGRRTPAWCDRILSFGKGMRLLRYRTTDLRLSDHRPVTASYMVEVEVFCARKLQRALTFTDAEVENLEFVADDGIPVRLSHL